ncbi:MAG: hypothetical protein ACRYGI_03805 [Janthinobacterium lividum]
MIGRFLRPVSTSRHLQRTNWSRLSLVLAIVMIACATCVLLTFRLPRNSDDASIALAASAVLHGNWQLSDWLITTDNYVTTDVALYAILMLFLGPLPQLMQILEGLLWAGVALVGIRLAVRGMTGRAAVSAGAACFTLLVLTIHKDTVEVDALGILASHASTVLLSLIVFWIAVVSLERQGPRLLTVLGILVVIGTFADPVFDLFACLPVGVTALMRCSFRRMDVRKLALAGTVLGSTLIGYGLLFLNAATGGFHLLGLPMQFVSFEGLSTHALFAVHSLMQFMGADFTGKPVAVSLTSGVLVPVIRTPFVILLVLALWTIGRPIITDLRTWPQQSSDAARIGFLDQLLWTTFVFYLCFIICSSLFSNQADARYVIPAFAAGSILLARSWAASPLFTGYTSVALAASVIFESAWILTGPARPIIVTQAQSQLIDRLQQEHLTHGYAGYWDSSILTAASGGHIISLAMLTLPTGRFVPFEWDGSQAWYKAAVEDWHGRVFFIASNVPDKPMDLRQSDVKAVMGAPERIIETGTQLIDIYELTPGLLDTRLR